MRRRPVPMYLSCALLCALAGASPSCQCDGGPWYTTRYMDSEGDAAFDEPVAEVLASMTSFYQATDGTAELSGHDGREDAWIVLEDGDPHRRGCSGYCPDYDAPYRTTYRIVDMSPQLGDWTAGSADVMGSYVTVEWSDGAGGTWTVTWYVLGEDDYTTGTVATGTDTGSGD